MKIVLAFVGMVFFSQISFAANLIVCTKLDPSSHWYRVKGGKFVWQGRGPGLVINLAFKRVTWIGTGGSILLTGEQNAQGMKIIKIEGRHNQSKILFSSQVDQVSDFQLQDRFGGIGLLRVFMDGHVGRANWQHPTDSMKEDLTYCTTNVLN